MSAPAEALSAALVVLDAAVLGGAAALAMQGGAWAEALLALGLVALLCLGLVHACVLRTRELERAEGRLERARRAHAARGAGAPRALRRVRPGVILEGEARERGA